MTDDALRAPDSPMPIWTQPHLADSPEGWWVVINQRYVAGPFADEDEGSRRLKEIVND